MELLSKVSAHYRLSDEYAIVPLKNHVLWEHALFPHCSSRAAWQAYQEVIDQIPAQDWTASEGHPPSWAGCSDWRAFQDGVEKLCAYLRQKDVPLHRATVSAPVVLRPCDDVPRRFQRGKSHLSVYARIDFERDKSCAVEFAEGGELSLDPGSLAAVSGFRRLRLCGSACLVSFEVDLPCVARINALATKALLEPNVHDFVVFAAATAQPLDLPLPPSDILIEKLEWLNARSRKQYRHQICPAVRRFLINGEDARSATTEEVNRIRAHGLAATAKSQDDLAHSIPALNNEQCSLLRQFADDHMTSVTADSVDDYPEYQVNLSVPMLSNMIGSETVDRLLRLPERIGAPGGAALDRLYSAIDCILRVYSTDTRPYIAFHSDTCQYTVNVSLNSEDEFEGGELLAVVGSKLESVPRLAGSVVVHSGHLVHGVSRIRNGVRYSLILFFSSLSADGTRTATQSGVT